MRNSRNLVASLLIAAVASLTPALLGANIISAQTPPEQPTPVAAAVAAAAPAAAARSLPPAQGASRQQQQQQQRGAPPPPPQRTASPETARGIELYKQGRLDEAVQPLKNGAKSDDAEAWHFLGLLYKQQGKLKDALKSFEKASALRIARLLPNIPAETQQAYGELSQEERARRLAQVVADYNAAAETVAAYVSLNPEEAGFWQSQLTSLHYYAAHIASTSQSERVYAPGDVTARAQFLQKSYPIYTERARQKQRRGTVVLRVILASDATVRHVIALRRLPDGLTEAAVAAARASSFTPAIKDGRPVSVWATLEYNFNIY